MSKDVRRFNEREAGAILRRVAELHESEREPDNPRWMSQSELEEVVGDLGISKALVARATAELALQDRRNQTVWWLGGKTDILLEATVDHRISDCDFDRMIEIMRRSFADSGELSVQGNARIWTATRRTTRRVMLTVVEAVDEEEHQTSIRLEERMPMDARSTVGLGTGLGFFAATVGTIPLKIILGKAVLALALPGVFVAGATLGWLVGRKIWSKRGAHRERELQSVFAELRAIANAPTSSSDL